MKTAARLFRKAQLLREFGLPRCADALCGQAFARLLANISQPNR